MKNSLIIMIHVLLTLNSFGEELVPVVAENDTVKDNAATQPAVEKGLGSGAKNRFEVYTEGYTPPISSDEESIKLRKLIEEIAEITGSPVKSQGAEGKIQLPVKDGVLPQTKTSKSVDVGKAASSTDKALKIKNLSKISQELSRNNKSFSVETLKRLEECAIESVVSPELLAESLYKGNCLNAAYALYKKCFEKTKVDNDKSWFLYQMANCMRKSDRAKAIKLYGQVMQEYGETVWAVPAKSHKDILQWLDSKRPEGFLQEIDQACKDAGVNVTEKNASSLPAKTSVNQPANELKGIESESMTDETSTKEGTP